MRAIYSLFFLAFYIAEIHFSSIHHKSDTNWFWLLLRTDQHQMTIHYFFFLASPLFSTIHHESDIQFNFFGLLCLRNPFFINSSQKRHTLVLVAAEDRSTSDDDTLFFFLAYTLFSTIHHESDIQFNFFGLRYLRNPVFINSSQKRHTLILVAAEDINIR